MYLSDLKFALEIFWLVKVKFDWCSIFFEVQDVKIDSKVNKTIFVGINPYKYSLDNLKDKSVKRL